MSMQNPTFGTTQFIGPFDTLPNTLYTNPTLFETQFSGPFDILPNTLYTNPTFGTTQFTTKPFNILPDPSLLDKNPTTSPTVIIPIPIGNKNPTYAAQSGQFVAPYDIPGKDVSLYLLNPNNPSYKNFGIDEYKKNTEGNIKDAKGKTDWNKIKAIQKHGISFNAPKSEWTNDYINENELTPTEMILNAKGSIKFVNGNGAGQYIIEKAKNVPGVDYTASAKFTWINPDGSVQVKSEYLPLQKSGNNIDMVEETLATYLEETDYNNSEMVRMFQQTGNTEALGKLKTHFKVPPKGGYQY